MALQQLNYTNNKEHNSKINRNKSSPSIEFKHKGQQIAVQNPKIQKLAPFFLNYTNNKIIAKERKKKTKADIDTARVIVN